MDFGKPNETLIFYWQPENIFTVLLVHFRKRSRKLTSGKREKNGSEKREMPILTVKIWTQIWHH